MARRQQNQWLVKNPICRKFAHETNPCAKIVNKFAREFAHMRFPSLQRLMIHIGKVTFQLLHRGKTGKSILKKKLVCSKFRYRFAYAKFSCKASCKFATSLLMWISKGYLDITFGKTETAITIK